MIARRLMKSVILLIAAALLAPATVLAARTVADQPALDISKMPYKPIGSFKPGDLIPATTDPPKPDSNGIYNPSGHFSAYDTNLYESLNFPTRQADDDSNHDPLGNGGEFYGFCPQGGAEEGGSDPRFFGSGRCWNHQLEYLDHYERTMKSILGDFGVVIKRYQFESPGSTNPSGERSAAGNNGVGTSTAPGRSFNIAAEVPGADNPEESVIVSGHYDFTDSGPAAAWDSSEGHAEVIRMAQIMADYWRATGTRPSATVKFMPWDQEETGTVGSKVYTNDNVPPGEADEIRGYFNVDPCAGAFPAYYHGSGDDKSRVRQILGLADPAGQKGADAAEVAAFNKRAETIVDEVFEHVDDTIAVPGGKSDIFVTPREAAAEGKTADRDHVVTSVGGLLLFGSDYSNFAAIGVPFFNLFPDMFGSHANPQTNQPTTSNEGVAILHTAQDNLLTLNRLTSSDQTGQTASEGWMKGMEICAQLESWGMLQHDMGGAQTMNSDPIAYYTALPNEAIVDQEVSFDAAGSYQYQATGSRSQVPESDLEFRWDFGDGQTGEGRTVKHAYAEAGKYPTTLTVVNRATGQTDQMAIPMTVVPSNFLPPVLGVLPTEDEDGTFPLKWDYAGTRAGLKGFVVEEAEDFRTTFKEDAEGALEVNWTANKPANPKIQPWQKSDSATQKLRGNQKRSGKTSFWSGERPQDFHPNEVATGDSILTSKGSVEIPKEGSTTLDYFSLFQNEGDDSGRVEVAIDDDNPATAPDWEPVKVESATNTSAGGGDELICDPSNPAGTATAGFHPVSIPLDQYKGRKLQLRFIMRYGPENRAASQPCGWYVDDIRVTSGDFIEIGQTPPSRKDFTVTLAPTGTDGYRIRGLFNDGVRTGSSNVESIKVIHGGPSRRARGSAPASTSASAESPTASAMCASVAGFELAEARTAGKQVRFGFSRRFAASPATVDVSQVSRGRRVFAKPRPVASFADRELAFTWNGLNAKGNALSDGYYVARFASNAAGRTDARRVGLRRVNGELRPTKAFAATPSCGIVRSFAATSPVFGGTRRAALRAGYRLSRAGRVTVTLVRGKRVVKRTKTARRAAGRRHAVRFAAKGLRRGTYKLKLKYRSGKTKFTKTVTVRRL